MIAPQVIITLALALSSMAPFAFAAALPSGDSITKRQTTGGIIGMPGLYQYPKVIGAFEPWQLKNHPNTHSRPRPSTSRREDPMALLARTAITKSNTYSVSEKLQDISRVLGLARLKREDILDILARGNGHDAHAAKGHKAPPAHGTSHGGASSKHAPQHPPKPDHKDQKHGNKHGGKATRRALDALARALDSPDSREDLYAALFNSVARVQPLNAPQARSIEDLD